MAYRVKGEKGGYGEQYAQKAMGMPIGGMGGGGEEGPAAPRNKRNDRPAPRRQEDNTRENLLRGMPSLQKKEKIVINDPTDNPYALSKTKAKKWEGGCHDGTLSESEESEDDVEFMMMRARRLSEMKQFHSKHSEYLKKGHGSYSEITSDEFLPAVTTSKYCVVHFYHKDFQRCKIIDKHLKILAPKHIPCRFMHIDADKSPFFVEKLKIKMLPSIFIFIDGVTTEQIIGFNELGGQDDFPTWVLEARLGIAKVLIPQMQPKEKPRMQIGGIRVGNCGKPADSDDSGSDLDL